MSKLKAIICLLLAWAGVTGILILGYVFLIIEMTHHFTWMPSNYKVLIAKTVFIPILIVAAIFAAWIIPAVFKKSKKTAKVDNSTSSRWLLNETEKPTRTEIENFNKIYKYNDSAPGFVVRAKADEKRGIVFNSIAEKHALVVGSTGSGKTQKIIIPSAIYNSRLAEKEKPSMVFTDPKGELFTKMSKVLKNEGYEIKVLNLSNPLLSDCWNPLSTAYKYFSESLQKKNKNEEENLISVAYEEISDLTSVLFPKPHSDNPMWAANAKRMVTGVCQAILEIKAKHPDRVSIEKFNLPAVSIILAQQQEICSWFKNNVPKSNKSYITTSQVINSAEVTRQGAFSNIAPALEIFEDYGLRSVLSDNNIDLFNICSSPTPFALFLIVPDEKDSRHILGSLFISQLFKASVFTARQSPDQTLPRKLLFFLDEFGNMPAIPNFASMVTVGRSRGIFFEMVLQAFGQLNEKYGENIAKTIRGNCGLNIYLHTNDAKTAKEYSELYGNMTVKKDVKNKMSSDGKTNYSSSSQTETKPLIDYDRLMKLKDPYGIVLSAKENPAMVYMEYSWKFKNIGYGSIELKPREYKDWTENYYFDIFGINLRENDKDNPGGLGLKKLMMEEKLSAIDLLEKKTRKGLLSMQRLKNLRSELSVVRAGSEKETVDNGEKENTEENKNE